MKKFSVFIFLIVFTQSSFAVPNLTSVLTPRKRVDLIVGQSEQVSLNDKNELDFDFPKNFVIKKGSNYKKYLKVFFDEKNMSLKLDPIRAGSTTFVLQDKKREKDLKVYNVVIVKNELNQVANEVKNLLTGVEGIDIKILSGKVVLDGQVILPSDMERIFNVLKQYNDTHKGKFINLVTLSPLAYSKIVELIRQEINNSAVKVRYINGWFILDGIVDTAEEKIKANEIAQTYIPDSILTVSSDSFSGTRIQKNRAASNGARLLDYIKVRVPRQRAPEAPKIIQVVFHYVDLQKTYNKGFRFQWTPTLNPNAAELRLNSSFTSTGSTVGTIAAVISNLVPRLNWARDHGYARVLDTVSLLVENNGGSQITSSQQIPYTSVGADGVSSTQFNSAGITANIKKATLLENRDESIRLDLTFKSGEPLETNGNGQTPIAENEISTTLTIPSGKSAAIGGIMKQSNSVAYNRNPDSAPNPIFNFFAAKSTNRNHRQFVVFVTPIKKYNSSEGVDKVKEKFRLNF